jgi:acetyltransferase-like isoleucine patch superfamily enzyme
MHQKINFLSTNDLQQLEGNTFYSPISTLISPAVVIGKNNIFYPNVVIECTTEGSITIGDDNIFYPGTYITSSAGFVHVGSGNDLGPAGLTIKANNPDAAIEIGDQGRYTDGASIMGRTTLGSGSQVLGAITVQNCTLEEGGSFQENDPDKRGAV